LGTVKVDAALARKKGYWEIGEGEEMYPRQRSTMRKTTRRLGHGARLPSINPVGNALGR